VRDLSGVWWWFLTLGVLWTLFGTYVLSYRVGSLAAVAALVGVAFLFGRVSQLMVAGRVQSWRWLFVAAGILGVWAVRSWQRSLLTLVTLVGVWAIFHGVAEIFAAFTLREAGKRAERLVG
jgi:uncharacterized membrane protein HdeD (DUF308 family)